MSKNYIVELKGVGIVNKGAYLMLLSLLEGLNRINKNIEFCTKPNKNLTHDDLCKLGIKPKISFRDKKLPWDAILGLISKKNLKQYGLIHNKEIDIIIDSSGFAYGDFWGTKYIVKRLRNIVKKKVSPETKLIFMPQAYGSFQNKKLKNSFKQIVDRADLIFVRDSISYDHLILAYGENDKFILSPDFTNFLNAGDVINYSEGNICIIPNYKMNVVAKNENYLIFLKKVIQYLLKNDEAPYFLIHEGSGDYKIAKKINEQLSKQLPIVKPHDPIIIKNRIKSSKLTVVSRYHGLVSALSQGVPVIATSWSHKYEELLNEYDKMDALVDINNYSENELEKLLNKYIHIELESYKKEQKKYIQKETKKVMEMWEVIESKLF